MCIFPKLSRLFKKLVQATPRTQALIQDYADFWKERLFMRDQSIVEFLESMNRTKEGGLIEVTTPTTSIKVQWMPLNVITDNVIIQFVESK